MARRSLAKEALDDFDARARDALRAEKKAIRERLARIRKARQSRVRAARQWCSRSRKRTTQRAGQIREQHRNQARAEVEKLREASGSACARRVSKAKQTGTKQEQRARQKLQDAKAYERSLGGYKPKRKRTTSRERKQQSDAAVRRNLPPELVPVWDSMATEFHGGPRKSRTEEFLEWVQENPAEIVALTGDWADAQAAEDIAEHNAELKRIEQALRKTRLRADDWELLGVSPDELRELGLVPESPDDVLAFLELSSEAHESADVPF